MKLRRVLVPQWDMKAILEVDHLSVAFGAATVLSDLSFRLEEGDSLAVIGPNGAGKTVLFRALIGSIPFQGGVSWAPGTRIGYVPQTLDIDRDIPLTGADFISAGTAVAKKPADATLGVLKQVGISHETADKPIGTLSGGQFQRLLIAFALSGDPNVLLLDEPTAGVDGPGQELLNELVRQLQASRNLTVLFISHELSVVYRYAVHVLCIGGKHTCFGTPREALTPDLLNTIYGTRVNLYLHDH